MSEQFEDLPFYQLVNNLKNLTEIVPNDGNTEADKSDFIQELGRLMALPEDAFSQVAPHISQSYQQLLNTPSERISLATAFNAMNLKADSIQESLGPVLSTVDQSDFSVPKKEFLKGIILDLTNAMSSVDGASKHFVSIPVEFCGGSKLPAYAHVTDSGMDVYALSDIEVKPGETVLVPTGIKMAIPAGYEIQVRPKSGRALKTKLRVANTPGTIDSGYRDEIKVIIENVEAPIKDVQFINGELVVSRGTTYTIEKDTKFCQLVLVEVAKAVLYESKDISTVGENRNGGFGSSGLK